MTDIISDERRSLIQARFDRHRAERHISREQHVYRRRIELGKSLVGKTKIYLDKRYWIFIRDVVLGRRTDKTSIELLEQLKRLVQAGSALCPISDVLFVELLKQEDAHTRRETAKLMDELSLGVTLATEDERTGIELGHFFKSVSQSESVDPLDWQVWMKMPFVLGMQYPSGTPFDPQTELVIQKAFFDDMWEISLVRMLDSFGDAVPPSKVDFDAIAERLTRESRAHAHENRTFKDFYESELVGSLSLYIAQATNFVEQIYERDTGSEPLQSEPERKQREQLIMHFFVNAFKAGNLTKQLPGFHVHALCYAAVRWDKQRKFDGNDLMDFHHAVAALGYCDLFFTEGSLRTLLTSRHVALDKELECIVISDMGEAAERLRLL